MVFPSTISADRFQSLFYWNGLLRRQAQNGTVIVAGVSILVLLEWSSEVSRLVNRGAEINVSILVLLEWSSEARRGQPADVDDLPVSILVLLEWSSEAYPARAVASRATQFQSLFYWNGLLRNVSVGR